MGRKVYINSSFFFPQKTPTERTVHLLVTLSKIAFASDFKLLMRVNAKDFQEYGFYGFTVSKTLKKIHGFSALTKLESSSSVKSFFHTGEVSMLEIDLLLGMKLKPDEEPS